MDPGDSEWERSGHGRRQIATPCSPRATPQDPRRYNPPTRCARPRSTCSPNNTPPPCRRSWSIPCAPAGAARGETPGWFRTNLIQGFTLTTLPFFQVMNGMFQRLCSARRALLMAFAAAFPRSSAAVGTGGAVLVVDAVAFTFMAKGVLPTGEGSHARRTGSIPCAPAGAAG